MEGLILLDKLPGMTSANAVDRVKRLLPKGVKIGHAGTLDPFASGLLILLVGRATRSCERVMSWSKSYVTSIRLDMSSPTHDTESPQIAPSAPLIPRSQQDIDIALSRFVGNIQQIPPVYSALKIRGKRACDRLRAGESVELSARTVRIHAIEVLEYVGPLLKVRIDCGRGTYIRAIARDLGQALGTGGMLTELRRTRIGEFPVEKAVTLERLTAQNISQHLISIDFYPAPCPEEPNH
jgi:tRNA pseudouridine55 synthase